ncbi:ABC transporter permease [bacterium]|nr:ABC transporter permease [bacterium]
MSVTISDSYTISDFIPERIIRPRRGLIGIDFKELWIYRELFWFLAWRDILVLYKQTAIGIAWAVFQPVVTMVVFTLIFGNLAKLPSNNASYAVMTFAALLPWQFFSNAITKSSNSLISSQNLITKVYFPRIILPASATISGAVDFMISFVVLIGIMVWCKAPFRLSMFLLPLFFLFAFFAAFGAGLWLGALNVKYRDVNYVVTFLVRLGMYISPVGFISSVIPQRWRFVYSLNPMVGVIDGFRWCILGEQFKPYWPGFWASFTMVLMILVTGICFFRSTEKNFADVI